METHEKLREVIDLDLYRSDEWDWLGELAEELGILSELEDRGTVMVLAQLYGKNNRKELEKDSHRLILDPKAGTGRLILAHYRAVSEDLMFFGTEANLLKYRIALLNMHINGIKAFILHADPRLHDLDSDSKNWLSANQWTPLKWNDLVELPTLQEAGS